MNTTTNTQDIFNPVWHHLDQSEDSNGVHLLTTSAEAVEAVQWALLTGEPVNAKELAALLGHAARDIRAAHRHIGNAIVELGDLAYNQ